MRAGLLPGVLFAAAWMVGCDCGTGARGRNYACTSTADCADTFSCVGGICVSTSGAGGGAQGGGSALGGGGGAADGGGPVGGGNADGGGATGGGSADGGGATGGGATGGGSAGGGGATGGGSAGGGGATGGGATGGGGAAGGGVLPPLGGGSAMGGGMSTGGGAACTPYVTIASNGATETALVDDGTVHLAFIADANPNTLIYGECTAGCDTQTPTFVTTPLLVNRLPTHFAMAPRTGGGVIIAVTVASTTKPDLLYLECAGACMMLPSWVSTLIKEGVFDARPGIASAGATTVIGYNGGSDTEAALCDSTGTGTCGARTSWSISNVSGSDVKHTASVAAVNGITPTFELAIDVTKIFACTGSCAGWATLDPAVGTLNQALASLAAPFPRIAGVTSTGDLKYSECPAGLCTSSTSWTTAPSVTVSVNSQIDLDLMLDGGPSVLYRDLTGSLARRFPNNSAWATEAIKGCGMPLAGGQPSQRIGPTGVSVLYSTGAEVRYHAP